MWRCLWAVWLRGPLSVTARVDLSGVPESVCPALVPIAVEGLRHCFNLTVSTASFIVDAGCASLALGQDPIHIFQQE